MSFYTSGIHTKSYNPTSNSTNFRTEIRLNDPDAVYLSNLRLCAVGFVTPGGATELNQLMGFYAVIKNLSLMDGNVVLDQVLDFNKYAGFRCFNKSNDDNYSANNQLKRNNMGFVTTGQASSNNESIVKLRAGQNAPTSVANQPGAWLSLKDYLAFLDSSQFLPSAVFKDLRLVIEYETSLNDLMPNGTNAITTIEPYLMADMLTNENAKKNALRSYKGVVYQPVEHSRVFVPALEPTAGAPNPEQELTFTINSFANKTVNRLVVIKSPVSTTSTHYGRLGSVGMFKETCQLNINGSNLLPGNGLTSFNQRQAMLYDLWNDCDAVIPGNWAIDTCNIVGDPGNIVGQTDYTSVMVQNYVEQFQYIFGRTGQYNTAAGAGGAQRALMNNQALNLNMFAEVNKLLQVNPDGSYAIRYI